jgi:hypothetical protein
MRFVFVSFLFLVDDFDLSVSSVTRNRADQPIRPSACARQCPRGQIVRLAGVQAQWDFSRTTLDGGREIAATWQTPDVHMRGQHQQLPKRQAERFDNFDQFKTGLRRLIVLAHLVEVSNYIADCWL